jgi:hypothetical protein
MANFSTSGTPTIFEELNKDSIETVSVLAYSPAAAILRRSSKDEPFVSHPVCCMLSDPSAARFDKLKSVYEQNFRKLEGCVDNMGENGLSYRLEATFQTKLESVITWTDLKSQFDQICVEMKDLSKKIMYEHGMLYPKETFPLGLKTVCLGFKPTLDKYIAKVVNNEYITIKEKETATAIENLLIFSINGNERGLSHSYFSQTCIRQNILKYNFPFTAIDINLQTLETDLSSDYYCSRKLLQQVMNPHLRNDTSVTSLNELLYRIENLVVENDFEHHGIILCLKEMFRSDVANIFKKRLMKCNIEDSVKFRLFELDASREFFNQMDNEVALNAVILNLFRLFMYPKYRIVWSLLKNFSDLILIHQMWTALLGSVDIKTICL